MYHQPDEAIQIAGAGPAGLVAAITLAQAGRKVLVHEMHDQVGYRFGRDLQGLENWTTAKDVLAELEDAGITTEFAKVSCCEGMAFDAKRQAYKIKSSEPFFYLVERGPGPTSLDNALLAQARDLGVEVRFNSRVIKFDGPGIMACGPQKPDAIAVGYHFDTAMENGFWIICDNTLAPKGYAYLLVMNGKGTVKSCMFTGFKQKKLYVQRTIKAFEEVAGLQMSNAKSHGGVVNFYHPVNAIASKYPVVGEQAGFQDNLWGFGMRHAINSGLLAAHSMLEGGDYNTLWQQNIKLQLQVSMVNRMLYGMMGNTGYKMMLSYLSKSQDPRKVLRHQYKLSWMKTLLLPWARQYCTRKRN